MMEDLLSKWVVVWSEQQQCFNYESVERMLDSNINSFKRKKANQYVPLAFFESSEEARNAIQAFKKHRPDLNEFE
ncbi:MULTISPECIES: hypothetical protein [unclassified Pseudoalteromonas]|jgi:hypothetical protein|uniref:hypothetical protein n=1 Tax=unclassified Pseudoalteromonas TaxID=194690 RepID=UPI0023594E33|nr:MULTISPECIES: hypothetical protein [unclassified Pseudoalteromonas]MCP4056489.1 hypothetical protein [Pseudoalteromonas sp.]MDC9502900.1 hypothetical protein [Pseudoalteromonas sp. Angola-18]MDC9530331.1 hypothetical protein [Pseudoalteromonas sp. Angola-7]